ncbi:MAG: hypothetical protein ACP5NZ_02220 [Nanobdellota archaeon]
MKKGVVIFSDKKFLLLVSSLLVLLVGVSMISATSRGYATNSVSNTIVEGNVYYSMGGPASFANVTVECDTIPLTRSIDWVCDEKGHYRVVFNSADNCGDNSIITVSAVDAKGINGHNSGKISSHSGEVDVELYNGNVVPEFGFFVGVLTIFGAVGVFFIIRKR